MENLALFRELMRVALSDSERRSDACNYFDSHDMDFAIVLGTHPCLLDKDYGVVFTDVITTKEDVEERGRMVFRRRRGEAICTV